MDKKLKILAAYGGSLRGHFTKVSNPKVRPPLTPKELADEQARAVADKEDQKLRQFLEAQTKGEEASATSLPDTSEEELGSVFYLSSIPRSRRGAEIAAHYTARADMVHEQYNKALGACQD